jgi:hypothetical protein
VCPSVLKLNSIFRSYFSVYFKFSHTNCYLVFRFHVFLFQTFILFIFPLFPLKSKRKKPVIDLLKLFQLTQPFLRELNCFFFEKNLIKLIYIYETIRRGLNKKTRKIIRITFYKTVAISALACRSEALPLVKKQKGKEGNSRY